MNAQKNHLDIHLRFDPAHWPTGTSEILREHEERARALIKYWSEENQSSPDLEDLLLPILLSATIANLLAAQKFNSKN